MKTVVIANPNSGRFNESVLNRCVDILRKRYFDVTLEYTAGPGKAGRIATASGADLVIAAGGDGLINETIAGIIGEGLFFSALPFGTVNVFCREYKIPLNPVKAAVKLSIDNSIKIPLGFIGDRPFALMCGFGYDARVVRQVTLKGYSKRKTFAHCLEGISSLNARYPELTIYVNDHLFAAYHVIISLGRRYAGNFILSDMIKNDALNIFVHQDGRRQTLLYTALSVAVGNGFPEAPIYADTAEIHGISHCQLDGEYMETGTMRNCVRIQRSALTVLS